MSVHERRQRSKHTTSQWHFACGILFSTFISAIAAAADGDVDTTFGSAGFIVLNSFVDHSPAINTQANAVAIDGSGRIVIAGGAQHVDPARNATDVNFLLLRLTPGGSVDTAFASDDGGYRLINFDLTGLSPQVFDAATDLAIQSDGKIAAIGNAYVDSVYSHFAAVRVDDSGALDATFGGSGMVHLDAAGPQRNSAQSLAVDAAGNLLLAGTIYYPPGSGQSNAIVAPLTSLGTIDSSFNSGNGVSAFVLAPSALSVVSGYVQAIGLDGAGRILVAGNYDNSGSMSGGIQRLAADGTAAFFAGGDPALTPSGFTISALLVDPDGSFVVCGEGTDGGGQHLVNFVRFSSDGTMDTNFGTNGVTTFPVWGRPTLIARTRRGGWLMAGGFISSGAEVGAFIAKVLANGQPDTTLPGTGFASVPYQPDMVVQTAKPALTADGKLIVAETLLSASGNGSGTIGLMRMYADYDTLFVGNFEAVQ